MFIGPPPGFRWPALWRPLTESEASREVICPQPFSEDPLGFTFEAELEREVCSGHPLYQVECWAVARNGDHPDEFLFATANPSYPLAFVHLTWSVETEPTFPYTIGYRTWEVFRSAWENSSESE